MPRAAAPRRDGRGGFALIEIMLALMLIAVLAALALPGFARATGPAALRVAAFQVSALLREDRNVALGTGRTTTTMVEPGGRRLVSGTSAATVEMPVGTVMGLRDAVPRILFFADGRSSGGDIVIAAAHSSIVVTVSPDTGAIRVAAP